MWVAILRIELFYQLRIPDDVRSRVVTLALDQPELSPRELAVRFTDAERYFVSEVLGLSPAQGPRPDHQPGLHHDEGRGRVQEQDDRAEPAVRLCCKNFVEDLELG
jgi:hypothetical protein